MDKDYYRFYQEVGERYPEEEIVYNTLRGRLRKKFVLQHLDTWSGLLLDIGCNKGTYLTEYRGGTSFGVDISSHVLYKAKEKCKGKNLPCNLIVGDAEQLSFLKDRSFDKILCSELLEHVYNPEKVIADISRLLKPNGTLLVTVPNYTRKRPEWIGLDSLKNYNIPGVKGDTYFHTAFKPHEVAEMVKKSGLRIIDYGSFEKEVRYATKIPVIFYYIFAFFNKILLRSEGFAQWNKNFLDRFSAVIYIVARYLHLDSILKRFFREGARTFVVANKH